MVSTLALGGLLLVIIATLGAAGEFAPREADKEFFSAAAQVIPVLLVVLALEVRIFRLIGRRQPPAEDDEARLRRFITRAVLGVTLLYLVGGELWALQPLSSGDAAQGNAFAVWAAIAVGLVSIAYVGVFAADG